MRNTNSIKWLAILGTLLLLVLAILFTCYVFHVNSIFRKDTIIAGVDCSKLTVEEAKEKIQNQNQKIELDFFLEPEKMETWIMPIEGSNPVVLVSTEKVEEALLAQQQQREFSSENLFFIDEEALRSYLEGLFEMYKGFKLQPEDAYLKVAENGMLEIVPEYYGASMDFETAYQTILNSLKAGERRIDLTPLLEKPKVFQDDAELTSIKESVNQILGTNIQFTQEDGTTICRLDLDILKDWVVPTENGKSFTVNFDENLTSFVELIAKEIEQGNDTLTFNATDLGDIEIPINENFLPTVDKESLISEIKSSLGKTTTIQVPYVAQKLPRVLDTYIELDITRQTVWMYKNGSCILESLCVTGNESKDHPTRTGIYFMYYKSKDVVLVGTNYDGSTYHTPVTYWMPFDGGIGFHDAVWRKEFGGEIYITDGSHGCVNMPFSSAKALYENITTDVPIIIYRS